MFQHKIIQVVLEMGFTKSSFTLQQMLFLTLFFTLAIFICTPPDLAHAGYLDSGSGSSFVQGIIAVLAFFGRMIDKVKKFLGIGKSKS